MTRRLIFIFGFVFWMTAWAYAKDDSYLRISRISLIEGNASTQQSTDVDWSAASINMPLEPGDRIYTGPDGKVEIEFDDGSFIRLAANTDLQVLSLKEDLIQLRILVGLSTLTVSSDVDYEMNTPAAAFNAQHKGVYRFDVAESGDTDAVVRKGEIEAANNSFSRRLDSGEQIHIRRGFDENPHIARYERRDAWDEWNDRRNADRIGFASRRYLPSTVYVGVSDLDRYGRWIEVDSYGVAWAPYSVDSSWSPYSIGRWCYRPVFGWTWISYEPWGWLPYHYGRWHHSAGHGWCWIPGPSFSFNFWSPGLVAFYNGPGWISWCPLGPGDYYNVNSYHYHRGIYGYQLARLRALDHRAPGDLFNRHVRGGFKTVETEHFRNGSFRDRNSGGRRDNVDRPWQQGSYVRDRLPIEPSATSYRPAPDRPTARPRNSSSMPVVVRTNPERDGENRERFSKITNPQIPPVQSRTWRNRNDQVPVDNGNRAIPRNETIQTPQAPRNDANVWRRPGNNSNEQEGRRMNTPRGSGSRENGGENSGSGDRAKPETRQENSTPSNQQSSPRNRIERSPTPPTRSQPPSEAKPRDEARQQFSFAEPRSSNGRSWNNLPRESSSGFESARPNNVFRQSNPSYERSNRSFRSPSSEPRTFSSAPNGKRFEGGSSFGRFDGGGRKAQEGNSNSAGRSRR